jgi:hypothetical protein
MTCGEVLFSVTGLAFAYREAPAAMKSVVQSCFLLTTALGNLLTAVALEACTRGLSQAAEFRVFATGCFAALAALLAIAHALGVGPDGGLGGAASADGDGPGSDLRGGGHDGGGGGSRGSRSDGSRPGRWARVCPSALRAKHPSSARPSSDPNPPGRLSDTPRSASGVASYGRRAAPAGGAAYGPMGDDEGDDNCEEGEEEEEEEEEAEEEEEEEEVSLKVGVASDSRGSGRGGGREFREMSAMASARRPLWDVVSGLRPPHDDGGACDEEEEEEFHEARGGDAGDYGNSGYEDFPEEPLVWQTRQGEAEGACGGGSHDGGSLHGVDGPPCPRAAPELVVDVL